MKAAFLDRDGTIIRDYPDREWPYVRAPVFLDGVFEAMRRFRNHGYEIIIVTNQYLIGEGILCLEAYQNFSALFLGTLEKNGISVLDVFYCPHARSANCDCCKPKPGLIRQALEKYPAINLQQSFLAGDSPADLQLAQTMGLPFYGIRLDCRHPIRSLNDIHIA